MQSYGIAVGADHLALITLSNLDRAAREEWGSDFRTPLQAIRKKFPYDHMHDDASIADMMGRLSGADAVRKLNDAPRKTNGKANAVTDGVGYLTRLLHDTTVKSDTGSKHAYAASTLHEYYPDRSTCSRGIRGRGRRNKKGKSRPPRENICNANEWKENPYRHCRKFKRRYQHDNNSATCFYNKK